MKTTLSSLMQHRSSSLVDIVKISVFLIIMSFAFVAQNTTAQNLVETTPEYITLLRSENPNIRQIVNSYTDYYKVNPWVKNTFTREYKRFLDATAWQNFDVNGNRIITKPETPVNLSRKVSKQNGANSATADWKALPINIERTHATATGQKSVIRCIAINPSNPNVVLAGMGGIWRSADKGKTWSENVAYNLPYHDGINHIEFSDSDPNYVYAATAAGIIKSTDGGITWSATKLDYSASFPNVNYAGDGYRSEYMWVDVSPNDPKTIIATDCNPSGRVSKIAKSTDGGTTWTTFSLGTDNFVFSLKFHPTNPKIVHALVKNGSQAFYYRSIDGGINFVKSTVFPIYTNTANKEFRGILATTPANPELLMYYLNVNEDGIGIFKSTDAGLTFSQPCCGTGTPSVNKSANKRDLFGENFWASQIRWASAFSISDVDANFMAASTNAPPRFSFDGGSTWYWTPDKKDFSGANILNMIYPTGASTYIHGDIQATAIKGNDVWVANDGGIALSEDKGQTYREVADGIPCDMALGFDNVPGTKDVMVIALDHNGVIVRDTTLYGDKWKPFGGGDASAASVNPIDDIWLYGRPSGDNILNRPKTNKEPYATYNNCSIQLGSGYMGQYNNVVVHPNNYYTLFTIDYKTNRVVKSINNGVTWTGLKQLTVDGYAYAEVKVAESNPSIIYASEKAGGASKLWKSVDAGTTWTSITPVSASMTSNGIRNIEVSSTDPNIVWVSIGGHQTLEKVLKSINGGVTWSSYTTGLPKNAIISMVHQRGTNGGVYVGTTYGIYYRNATMSSWVLHGTNFPAIPAKFLKINYANNKIRVGTHRGIWENTLYERSTPLALITSNVQQVACGTAIVQFASLSVVSNNKTKYAWSFPGGTPSSSSLERPEIAYSTSGNYPVSLTVTDDTGTNSSTIENFITVTSPCQDCKIPTTNWSLKSVDSQQTTTGNESAASVFDNNPTTLWHTRYSPTNAAYPHEIQIDLGETYNVVGFGYLPRQDGGVNGRIKNYDFYTSIDGISWTLQNSGTWANDATEKTVAFNATTARYVKLVAKSEVNGAPWASAAEISVYGTALPPNTDFSVNLATINEGESVNYIDLSSGKITSWMWSFDGGNPTISIDKNPTVTYSTAGIYPVSLATANIGGSDIESKPAYITVNKANAIKDVHYHRMDAIIAPNPIKNGNFSIQLINSNTDVTIEILNLTGQLIYSTHSKGVSNINIKSKSLNSNAVYLVRLKTETDVITKKIEVE